MTRLAFAAIVFCSTLYATLGQALLESPGARETPPSAAMALSCMPPDDDGREWRPTREPTAFIVECAWKWRAVQGGPVTTGRPAATIAILLASRPPARVTGAPAYLLHTPLLI